ncbi:rhomboid family intramembrane serine protease [Belliella kenyensis]|uniref:Rhomboid family intramembrane serine protease n=1 Tax=Belliella kenyensis TaxID=1472724 RepID=A0ABV8ERY8_9BACT|nr:rhomboid family intramembrane serine protease [Belliella kenyensis]MCH7402859.1 rhomboid family intramembrane serine protease [Belliella kenyensis]MDN3602565.1 rhomboid family intramembrane serine protease [Belliella kenyensis]
MFRNLTPVVKNLLLINIGVFVIASYFMPGLEKIFALYYVESASFLPTQFVTYMFMHANFWHLFSNMFGLFIFGPLLEQFLGPKKLLTLWMVCGVGSGLLYSGYNAYKIHQLDQEIEAFYANPSPDTFNDFVKDNRHLFKSGVYDFIDEYSKNPESKSLIQRAKENYNGIRDIQINIPMVGASGALFGILIAFAMFFPNTELLLLFPPMPVKAKYLVLFYGLYTVYNIFNNNPADNVAHFAHLSGLIVGGILVYYWKRNRKNFY